MDEDSFSKVEGFSSKTMRWDDVVSVYGESVDKVTFDESFLIFRDRLDNLIVLGEMDHGFSYFESMLQIKLDSFPTKWREWVDQAGPGTRIHIWSTNIA